MNAFRIALLNLVRNRRRTMLTLVVMAVATAGLADNEGLIRFIFNGLRDEVIFSRYGHLQIYREGYTQGYRQAPFKYLISATDYAAARSELIAHPGVRDVTAQLTMPTVLSFGTHKVSAIALGIEPGAVKTISTAKIVAGTESIADDGLEPTVLLGRGLADKLQARSGNTINIMVALPDGSYNAVDAAVQGIFEEGFRDFDDWSIKVPITSLQRLSNQGGVEKILVLLADTRNTKAFRADLDKSGVLARLNLEATTWYELADFYRQVVAMFGKELEAIKTIIEVIAFFAILICISISFAERECEMAVLLVMGATRLRLTLLLVQENFLLGLAGAGLGMIFAVVGAAAISTVGINMPPPPGSTVSFVARDSLSPSFVFQYGALTLFSACASSVLSALSLYRLNVANALRPSQG